MTYKEIGRLLKKTPPSCLKGFDVKPARLSQPVDEYLRSAWKIACRCGETRGRFLGYLLSDNNAEYDGPDFISPLSFKCSKCNEVIELLDTDKHGYHAEVGRLENGHTGSSKRRGKGPAKSLPCENCGEQLFRVKVGFVFWDADELEDIEDEHLENFFNEFLCECECVACGTITNPTHFGKL